MKHRLPQAKSSLNRPRPPETGDRQPDLLIPDKTAPPGLKPPGGDFITPSPSKIALNDSPAFSQSSSDGLLAAPAGGSGEPHVPAKPPEINKPTAPAEDSFGLLVGSAPEPKPEGSGVLVVNRAIKATPPPLPVPEPGASTGTKPPPLPPRINPPEIPAGDFIEKAPSPKDTAKIESKPDTSESLIVSETKSDTKPASVTENTGSPASSPTSTSLISEPVSTASPEKAPDAEVKKEVPATGATTPTDSKAAASDKPAKTEKPASEIKVISEKPPTAKKEIPSSAQLLIQTKGLVKQYGGRRVVNGVDLHVRAGEVVGLLGKNGAGKTTTFYMIVGLVPPTLGHVFMGEEDVTHMPMYRRARRGIGYLPQEESIFRKLTVEENLLAILETLPMTEDERENRCDELLKDFGLEHVRESVAITLSGGEKRRVTIARALVTSPSLLLLDEPFSGVDPMAVHDIQEIILQLKERGLGVLITDHNVRETLSVVDRACIIDEGRVLSEGTREFLLNDPIAREIYLGHRFSM